MKDLISGLVDPVRALLFTIGGAAIAWLWSGVGVEVALGVVVALFLLTFGVQKLGENLVATKPEFGMKLMETRVATIGILTAATGAVAIILTVELASESAAGYQKELLSVVSAALVAFITGVSVSPDKADAAVGKYIMNVFQSRYASEDFAQPGQVALKTGSDAQRAIMSSAAFGLTDWTLDNRRERIQYLVGKKGKGGRLAVIPKATKGH